MKLIDKVKARDAAVRGVPFECGGHRVKAVPFDHLSDNACYLCEMDSECRDDIAEMCDYVNSRRDYDEYYFKFVELCQKEKKP